MFYKGQEIGQYILIRLLGSGGFGEVWLAHNKTEPLSSAVAIKLPKSEDVDWQTIIQEIGLWVLCGNHPNVLPFLGARNYNGQIVIISEYAPDGSLRDLLRNQGALSHKQTVEMMIGVLDGLDHLHSSGIIHRDLKPENILLQGNTPRLADFGISRVMTINSSSQTVAGTYWYMAPEAFDRKRNAQTDIWSSGVILYEMLKGSLPFPQKELTALVGAIVRNEPEPLPPSVSASLKEVVHRALAKDATKRFQTVAEMRTQLHSLCQASIKLNLLAQEPKPLSQAARPRPPSPSTHKPPLVADVRDAVVNTSRLIPYRKGDKWGFCDASKRMVVEPKYDEVSPFSEGLARVQVKVAKYAEKYGFINSEGEEVIPLQLKYLGVSSFREGLARTRGRKDGFIDKTGKEVIPPTWDSVNDFYEGRAAVHLNKNYKSGFIDRTGKEVIPLKYCGAGDFHEGLAFVTIGVHGGFVDRLGREVIPLGKYSCLREFSDGLAAMEMSDEWGSNKKWGFIDKTGKDVIQPNYELAASFGEGLAIVKTKSKWLLGSKWNFIDRAGNVVFSLNRKEGYENWETHHFDGKFSDGLVLVMLNGKYGFIDKTGNHVIPCKYDNAFYYGFKEGLACVKLKDKWGYIGRDGTEYFAD